MRRGSNDQENIRLLRGEFGFSPHILRKVLAKPDYTWAQHSFAFGALGRQFGKLGAAVDKDLVTLKATNVPNVAVDFEDVAASRKVVQPVYVLGDEGKVGNQSLECCNRLIDRDLGSFGKSGSAASHTIPTSSEGRWPKACGVARSSARN